MVQSPSGPNFGSQAYFQAILSPGPADNTTVRPMTQDWQCFKCTRPMVNSGALATHLRSCDGRLHPRSERQPAIPELPPSAPSDNRSRPMTQDEQCPKCLQHMGNGGALATHLKSCDGSSDVPRPERQAASLDCLKCGRHFRNYGGAATHRSKCGVTPVVNFQGGHHAFCSHCGRSDFTNYGDAETHMESCKNK